jgi:hypothetical protein
MLNHLIKTTRTALTWPFDLAADFMRQTAEGLLDASHALEMLGNITDPNPTSGPWEPGEDDYAHAAQLIEQTEPLRHPWTETRIYRGDSQWTPADGVAIQTHADGSKTITGPPTDYSDSYTAGDAEVDGYWEDGDSA